MKSNNIILEKDRSVLNGGATDYSLLLEKIGIPFTTEDLYLISGRPEAEGKWQIYLSVVVSQLSEMLSSVLPLLKEAAVPFRLACNKDMAIEIQSGHLGFSEIGKVITIYTPDETGALSLCRTLKDLLKGFKGPQVLSAAHVDGVMYAAYSASASIPFELSKGVRWPFNSIKPFTKYSGQSILNGKYKITSTIKEDAKGFVWTGAYLKNFVKATSCVIKEGRSNMMEDGYGRDTSDRLAWQLKLHKHLYGAVSIPKVYDYFRENGNTYLVLEYIEGQQLDLLITEIYNQRTWQDLSDHERLRLMNFALQIVSNISVMHELAIVHRDITSGNFLVTAEDKLVLIDLELSYSLKDQSPNPPFIMGTEGFMSPEQRAVQTPTIKEDIYAIGATLLTLFTGLLPTKWEIDPVDVLTQQLTFLIPEPEVVSLIVACLNLDPMLRPSLAEVKPALEHLKEKILEPATIGLTSPGQIQPIFSELDLTLQLAITGLVSRKFLSPEGLWFSKPLQDPKDGYIQESKVSLSGGYYAGQSGLLYVLARAHHCGLKVKGCMQVYSKALEFLQSNYLMKMDQVDGGLYYGMAGIGLAVAEGVSSGLLGRNPAAIQNIEACFSSGNIYGFSIRGGVSGQGLAILKCHDLLTPRFSEGRLRGLVIFLLEHQQRDGSWICGSERNPGFDRGVAGIVSFLLGYLSRYPDKAVELAIFSGLQWLFEQGISNADKNLALTYIQAYQYTGIERYRHQAEAILERYPERICARDQSQAGGLCGLGEVYLEAARAFNSERWWKRASWIVQLLLHQTKHEEETIYWQVDDSYITTADLMTGNAGIVHFILRHYCPGKLSHPLIP